MLALDALSEKISVSHVYSTCPYCTTKIVFVCHLVPICKKIDLFDALEYRIKHKSVTMHLCSPQWCMLQHPVCFYTSRHLFLLCHLVVSLSQLLLLDPRKKSR